MNQKYLLVSVEEWKAALASQAATARFLDRMMQQLDEAADTVGWVGPRMPWHDWADELGGEA